MEANDGSDRNALPADEWLLLNSVDDDYYGLWEIPVEFYMAVAGENVIQGHLPRRQLVVQWVRHVLQNLLEKGFISVFKGTRFVGEETLLNTPNAESALGDLRSYEPQCAQDVHPRVIASMAGKKFLSSHMYPGDQDLQYRMRQLWLARSDFESDTQ